MLFQPYLLDAPLKLPKFLEALNVVQLNLPRVIRVKSGEVTPDRCELCDCCRYNRVLTAPISITSLLFTLMPVVARSNTTNSPVKS